jgi:hypothetical protein
LSSSPKRKSHPVKDRAENNNPQITKNPRKLNLTFIQSPLFFSLFSCYIYPMTITQTVDIPADRRITLEVPREVPPGKTILAFTPVSDGGGTGRKAESVPKTANERATPHSDALFAIFSQIGGDIDPDEIRSERLAKHLR